MALRRRLHLFFYHTRTGRFVVWFHDLDEGERF